MKRGVQREEATALASLTLASLLDASSYVIWMRVAVVA